MPALGVALSHDAGDRRRKIIVDTQGVVDLDIHVAEMHQPVGGGEAESQCFIDAGNVQA